MIKKNNKAMLANIIGLFIVVFVGIGLIGPIAQEINNAANCQISNSSFFNTINDSYDIPTGSTGSFGGAGSSHFGGYTGEVKHNAFVDALASTSMIKSDKSLLNPECTPITGAAASMLQLVPAFFSIVVLGTGLALVLASLRGSGLI